MLRFIIFFAFLICSHLFAQDVSKEDSLLKRIETTTSAREKIKIYNQLSKANWYINPSKTIEYGKEAYTLATELENDSLIIISQLNIGIGYSFNSSYDKAMVEFMQCLTLSEETGNNEGEVNALSNIATVYQYMGNYERAKGFYLKSLALSQKIKFNKATISSLNNLGNLYTQIDEYEKGLECYLEAIKIEESEGDELALAYTLSNIGDIYEYNGNNEKALEYYRSSYTKGEKLKSNTLIISSLMNIGQIHVKYNRYDSALFYLNKGEALSRETGYTNLLRDICLYISNVYDKMNNPSDAFLFYKKYAALKDSLLNEDSNNKISELQIKYDTDVKQKENVLLQKENAYQKNLRNFFIVLALLVIVLAIVLFRNYRGKKKSNILLSEKNVLISEQKEQLANSLDKVRISEELYRTLVSTSPDGIIITDMEANIAFISPVLLKIYNYDNAETVLGKKTLAFIEEASRMKAIRYFRCLAQGELCGILEIQGIQSDGAIIDIEINGGVLKDRNGEIYSLFFIFREITSRKKVEERKRMQQEMTLQQQKEIAEFEIQKREQENITLKTDLEIKNKELVSKAMHIIQNNELVNSVIETLLQLEAKTEKKEGSDRPELRSLINDLKTSVRHDSWKEFDTHFTQVHKDFYDNLYKQFPDLTSNEKKLCAFLRMNLSTKEIADITGKSVHSINVARTRLRQKLGITGSDDNLTAFLSRF